jgi:Pentapeptide repeats (8 copies)
MMERWKTLSRRTQWQIGVVAAVILVMAAAWALFVPAADWLAHHDVGSAKPALLLTARDAARGRLLTAVAGLFAAGALGFTALNFTLSRRTFELTEQGQVTERYTKAVEQLGSDKLDVRIGGIYALERIARDSARDHPTVMQVLTAFIRVHSRDQWPPRGFGGDQQERSISPDIQAAVKVVGSRDPTHDIREVNLAHAYLKHADLIGVDFARANLADVCLVSATLASADLSGADLADANLSSADLSSADLTGTHLARANLSNANLGLARLVGTVLNNANLMQADLSSVDLTRASLVGAVLNDANLADVVLTNADLTRALWPRNSSAPEGWRKDATGQLEPC